MKDIQNLAGIHRHDLLVGRATCLILRFLCLLFRVLIAFSQYLQKCSYDEHAKLVQEVTDFAKTCVADESAANCDKSLVSTF